MYAREWASRYIGEATESGVLAFIVLAGLYTTAATLIAFALLMLRGALRWWDAVRLLRRIAYVDLTVVPSGNPMRRPPPRVREYVN
jgi:hypothetical protein